MKSTPIKTKNYQAAFPRVIICYKLSTGNQPLAYGSDNVTLQTYSGTIDNLQVTERTTLVPTPTSTKNHSPTSIVADNQQVILNFPQDDNTPLTFTLADEESEKIVVY